MCQALDPGPSPAHAGVISVLHRGKGNSCKGWTLCAGLSALKSLVSDPSLVFCQPLGNRSKAASQSLSWVKSQSFTTVGRPCFSEGLWEPHSGGGVAWGEAGKLSEQVAWPARTDWSSCGDLLLNGALDGASEQNWSRGTEGLGRVFSLSTQCSFPPSYCKREPTLQSSGLSKRRDRWKDHFQNKGSK